MSAWKFFSRWRLGDAAGTGHRGPGTARRLLRLVPVREIHTGPERRRHRGPSRTVGAAPMRVNLAARHRLGQRIAVIATAATVITGLAGVSVSVAAPVPAAGSSHWNGAWASGQQGLVDAGPFTDTTLRLLVSPTHSGSTLRVRLANTFGSHPLHIDGASIAVVTTIGQPALVPGTSRAVRFHSAADVTVAQGKRVLSDQVR